MKFRVKDELNMKKYEENQEVEETKQNKKVHLNVCPVN